VKPQLPAKPPLQIFAARANWDLLGNRLAHALADAKSAGISFVDLTQSNPTACAFTYDQRQIAAALTHPDISRYAPDPRGMPVAREAVTTYYRQQEIPLPADDLILTSGTSEAYSFLFRLLCNPGDQVLIPSPGYPLFEFLADLCDVKLVRYPLNYDHGWQIDFSALAAASNERTRALIVVHPNNPTGHFASPNDQLQLSRFCAEREIALIADEVFLDFPLAHDQPRPTSFAGTQQSLTFTLSGISKICGLPQMKLAWIAVSGPEEQKKEALARLEIIADAYLYVGTPLQVAALRLLATSSCFQSKVIKRVQANVRELDAQLAQQSACNRLSCEGG